MYDEDLTRIAVFIVTVALFLFAIIPAVLFVVSLLLNYIFETSFMFSYLRCLAFEGMLIILKTVWAILPCPIIKGQV